ncbi:hypothetical protein MKN04_05520 [Paenibacillus polymyxa]|uniref:hypothetical protein n=1 Tax=Paenibacillus polymyxa TaxID=1406 RepID=UPI0018AF8FD5|nr:hypothetical protein [Paenibacillus polymyxa]MCH6187116.1 hypothetical protein [Paenibacillus polymyxa]WRL58901.1 hypothetical protein U3G77_11910 [Paenibacillus polymyxa]
MCRRKLTLSSAGNDRIQLPVTEGFPAVDRIGTLNQAGYYESISRFGYKQRYY